MYGEVKMDEKDIKDLAWFLVQPKEEIIKLVKKMTNKHAGMAWLYVPKRKGKKICLVAHVDTVWRERPIELRYSKKTRTIKTGNGIGIGADDRAGVYAIYSILKSLPKKDWPMVLFCDGEEIGGIGAHEAVEKFNSYFEDVAYFVELDRRGFAEVVYYGREPAEFKEYIESFGFEEEWGIFSDISVICPAVKKCGANLSVGFSMEHTAWETLDVESLEYTIDAVKEILDSEIREFKLPERLLVEYDYFIERALFLHKWG